MFSWLSTHVLDTTSGEPGSQIKVELRFTPSLDKAQNLEFGDLIGHGITDENGRIAGNNDSPWYIINNNINDNAQIGYYQLKFYILDYFDKQSNSNSNQNTFWPIITIQFTVTRKDIENKRHFHVPCLVSNYGFTTYRGSSNAKKKKDNQGTQLSKL